MLPLVYFAFTCSHCILSCSNVWFLCCPLRPVQAAISAVLLTKQVTLSSSQSCSLLCWECNITVHPCVITTVPNRPTCDLTFIGHCHTGVCALTLKMWTGLCGILWFWGSFKQVVVWFDGEQVCKTSVTLSSLLLCQFGEYFGFLCMVCCTGSQTWAMEMWSVRVWTVYTRPLHSLALSCTAMKIRPNYW